MQDNYPSRISGVTAEIIVAIMEAAKTSADAGKAYDGLCEKFDAVIRLCEVERLGAESAQELLYPLAALADEFFLAIPQYRVRWITNPLQLRYYGEMDAGAGFFTRLKKITDDPKGSVRLLELYFLCLAMGFKGKYGAGAEDELRVIFEDVGNALSDARKSGRGGLALTGYGNARKKIFTLRKCLLALFLILTAAAGAAYVRAFTGFLEFLGGIS